jgi:hypothetical protein
MKLDDDTKEVIIKVTVILVAVAIIVPIGIFAYKHRVVEKKQYSVVGVVTDKEHIRAYTTSRYDPNTKTVKTTRHPEKFYIYYSVSFEGATYGDNCEKVNKSLYNELKAGSEISCVYEKQWRADGSETYDIWVVR